MLTFTISFACIFHDPFH